MTMLACAQSKPRPWIEALILSYGSGPSSQRLKARVIRVEQMSPSQAQNANCSTGLLLLSDGFLLIPAVLTAAAWERLQEQEDRDSLEGLVNSKVIIQDYQLHFHMSLEQTKCRFFLSVGKVAMTSAGPPGYHTPCCTTLASVRHKIAQTWQGLLDEKVQDSQSSQSGLDLSLLLGEWQQDCMLDIVKDVEDRLQASTYSVKPNLPQASEATSWDVDRLRYKAETSYSVPVRCLLVPDVVQLQAAKNSTSQAPDVLAAPEDAASPQDCGLSRPPVHCAQAEADQDTAAGTELDASEDLPVSEDHMTGSVIAASARPPSNPWDIFTPLGDSPRSSGESATEATVQVCLPPYQQPLQVNLDASASGGAFTATAPGWCAPAALQSSAAQVQPPASENPAEGKAKRRRGEDADASRSPPSWLFDTQTDCGAPEEQRQRSLRKTPSAHSDGRPFSYSYRVSGQNLQDLSRFMVRTAWLQWASRYLLRPEQSPDATSDQGSSQHTQGLQNVN